MTIAGRNGAGKTTLLRMLAGETSIDRGELTRGQGRADRPARPAPAPRARRWRCATTCSRAARRSSRSRPSWPSSRERWPRARPTRRTLGPLRRGRRRRLEARGGYLWRSRATAMAHGLGFRDEDLDRSLDTFSGGQLTRASLARALATGADVLLLDEPTNHLDIESLEWLEQTLPELDAAVVLVAHDRWFLEAVGTAVLELEAGRSRFFAGSWHQWRARAGRARDRPRQGDRQAAGRDRAHGALHRALPLQGHEGPPGAVARQEAREDRAHRARPRGRAQPRVRLRRARALGARDLRAGGRPGGGRRRAPWCCSTAPSCGSNGASTSRSWGPTAPARRP